MSSPLDIVNLAYSKIGDTANVASIDPPESTPQSIYAARFYPIANKKMQEMHDWTFGTKRFVGALLSGFEFSQWKYAYALPAKTIKVISLLPTESFDDYTTGVVYDTNSFGRPTSEQGIDQTYQFAVEALPDGQRAILTNLEKAVIRATIYEEDSTKYSAGYIDSCSWLLASYLAGPIVRGDVGVKTSQACYQAFMQSFAMAASKDANNAKRNLLHGAPWMVNR